MMENLYSPPAPVIDKETKVLILGTYAGRESLERGEYYADTKNKLWEVIGEICGDKNLKEKSHREKINFLLEHKIGIGDIFQICFRKGSKDKSIIGGKFNNFDKIFAEHPNISLIVLNGKEAYKYSTLFRDKSFVYVPSTSPANQKHFSLDKWKEAFALIRE